MEIKARRSGNIIILDLVGKIDVNAANFIEAVGQCIHEGYTDILCNFEEVDFIDYMGISVMVIAYKEILNNNGRMKFVAVPVHLRNIFSVAGLDRSIEMYPTEDLAINSLKEDKIIDNIKKLQLRRRFKRLPVDIKVEVYPKYNKKATCLKLEILNLSAIGAYIYGCSKFNLGDEVIIRLKLAPKQEELELDAKVVWLPDKQVQPHAYPGMGVEFYNISKHLQEKLIEFVERNLSFMSTDD